MIRRIAGGEHQAMIQRCSLNVLASSSSFPPFYSRELVITQEENWRLFSFKKAIKRTNSISFPLWNLSRS